MKEACNRLKAGQETSLTRANNRDPPRLGYPIARVFEHLVRGRDPSRPALENVSLGECGKLKVDTLRRWHSHMKKN